MYLTIRFEELHETWTQIRIFTAYDGLYEYRTSERSLRMGH